jgi:hypothetical protein
MTELKLGSRLLMIVACVGLVTGIITGLVLGWVVWPVQIANVDIADLNLAAKEELIVLIADTYALDKDLARAKERLAQIQDRQVNERIAAMAKRYEKENKPSAANLAALSIALGNTDPQIALIATTATPTAMNTATPTATLPATSTPTTTPTLAPTPTITPTRTTTRRPVATATPRPAAIAPTTWIPVGFPSTWPPGAKYEPANVAPGQKYWRLVKAIYCDQDDEHDYCRDMPGGPRGTETYIMLVGGGSAPLSLTDNDGKVIVTEPKAAGDMCNCAYSFQSSGYNIQIAGSPSDKVSGLTLYSMKAKLSNWHVRYFLYFQLVTK